MHLRFLIHILKKPTTKINKQNYNSNNNINNNDDDDDKNNRNNPTYDRRSIWHYTLSENR